MSGRTSAGGCRGYLWLLVPAVVIVVLAIGAVLLIAFLRYRKSTTTVAPVTTGAGTAKPGTVIAEAPLATLPEMPTGPRPVNAPFRGCPPEGDGGDPKLNELKNRIDEGAYIPVQSDAILGLPDFADQTRRRHRDKWPEDVIREVERYEGLPVAVEGYLAGDKLEGPESPNCHGADQDFRDFHVWLTKTADESRADSIVVEITPAMRAKHARWNAEMLSDLVHSKDRVRISGWLMLDPEHPDQKGKTRGTIWEIHPIMKFEVNRRGQWIDVDDL